jgi:hypothetical protein
MRMHAAMDTDPELEHKPIAPSLSAGIVWIRRTRWSIRMIEVNDNLYPPSRRTVKGRKKVNKLGQMDGLFYPDGLSISIAPPLRERESLHL